MAGHITRRLFLQATQSRKSIVRVICSGEMRRQLFTSQYVFSKQPQEDFIELIRDDSERSVLEVKWKSGETSSYPHIFLRDNCQCPKCFHPDTKSRQLDTFQDIDMDITAKKIVHNQSHVTITWPDDHESRFEHTWLEHRKFPKIQADVQPTTLYGMKPIPWDASIMSNIPEVNYNEMVLHDEVVIRHLENLILYGLSIIKEAPTTPNNLLDVGRRMGSNLIRKTHYGELWDVKSKNSPNNLAYTSNRLSLHTDLPYYSYQPCIQLLHCIEQIGGNESEGCNVLADGLHVIEKLRRDNPEDFRILTTVKVRFNDVGKDVYGEFHKQYERPIIGLDHFGRVESVATSIEVRDSYVNAPVEDVIHLYRAYHKFRQMLHDRENTVSYKMIPGDILVFDNKRVVHGRSAYNAEQGSRWLQGCYIDWDEALSCYRVLKGKMAS